MLFHHLECDPFLVWLESSAEQWDGAPRLANLLTSCLGCGGGRVDKLGEHLPLLRADPARLSPGLFTAADTHTHRAARHGQESAPDPTYYHRINPVGFSDDVSVADAGQKRLEGMQGRVIVELSELTGFRRAELENLKAFISRRDDGATRLAYRHDPETALRRFILVGTSNDVECLPADPSGNTRFVPVLCSKGSHVEPVLAKWRTQLWAEGLALYSDGERANLPRELMGAAGGSCRNTPAQRSSGRRLGSG